MAHYEPRASASGGTVGTTIRSLTVAARKEYYVIESANPEVMGLDGAARSQVEYLYELAG
jgi:hypothetical protein